MYMINHLLAHHGSLTSGNISRPKPVATMTSSGTGSIHTNPEPFSSAARLMGCDTFMSVKNNASMTALRSSTVKDRTTDQVRLGRRPGIRVYTVVQNGILTRMRNIIWPARKSDFKG
ncbi:hypothetical protein POSPLADRAFT_1036165 [Postia placenta MAD-698-R-SB12]|uniref:Uncharacterized protein n=1 Tax=Postia placenta MAD-698-R-SB12 TaxID=670580 RepID=A0A1X6MQ04_9APHY|nr:hypothetical protein POSPLADRAFT_1036165 [Postia placenta MAD-698-R-SB12]OSX58475.1 hypothetical protein POSPLADRAFT_1036165 [Postia placenta MAD-698-R-SB12]